MTEKLPARTARATSPYVLMISLTALVPLAAVRVLSELNVPLGRPDASAGTGEATPTSTRSAAPRSRTFVYPYSRLPLLRLRNSAFMAPVAAAGALAILLAASSVLARRRLGVGLGLTVIGAGAYWAYAAPPSHISQHLLTLQSPSHDGAFVWESRVVKSIPRYLATFPQRARTPEEQMSGTRVISNPPLATVAAAIVRRWVRDWPALREFASRPFAADMKDFPPSSATNAITGIVYGWVLTWLWAAAGVTTYCLGRLFLPAAAALTFAICCVISPSTLLFSPGKDPAQLLSITIALFLWLAAYRGSRPWLALTAGVAAVLTTMIGLIHIWVGLIVLCATAWHAARVSNRGREFVTRCLLPGVAGVLLTTAFLQLTLQWNIIATILAVAQSQAEVTRGDGAMPLVWQALGIPLFMLFAGPALWTTILWRSLSRTRGSDARLGLYFQIGTVFVMVATVGFTNIEAPRLWIAFVPLLLLGAAMGLPAFSAQKTGSARLLAILVGCHLAACALQLTFMDMRETEMRWIEQRFFK